MAKSFSKYVSAMFGIYLSPQKMSLKCQLVNDAKKNIKNFLFY
jgi:hypothetical protein